MGVAMGAPPFPLVVRVWAIPTPCEYGYRCGYNADRLSDGDDDDDGKDDDVYDYDCCVVVPAHL